MKTIVYELLFLFALCVGGLAVAYPQWVTTAIFAVSGVIIGIVATLWIYSNDDNDPHAPA
jgi:uncharacterized membrane protein